MASLTFPNLGSLGSLLGAQTSNLSGYNSFPAIPSTKQAIMAQQAAMQAQSIPTTPHRRKFPPHAEAIRTLSQLPQSRKLDKVGMHYRHVAPESLIEHLGKIRPIRNGVPRDFVMNLLLAAARPHKFLEQFYYCGAGVVYISQPVAGRKKRKARLTVAGLMLLDHWAETVKGFKQFVDAFATKQARKEIYRDCFDFQMNALPAHFERDGELHAKHLAKIMQAEILRLRELADKQYNKAVYAAQTTTAPYVQGLAQAPYVWNNGTGNLIPLSTGVGTGFNGGSTIYQPITGDYMNPRLPQEIADFLNSYTKRHCYVDFSTKEVCVMDDANNPHVIWSKPI